MNQVTMDDVRRAYNKIQQMRAELEDERLTIIVHPDQLTAVNQAIDQYEPLLVRPHVHANAMIEPGQAIMFQAKKFDDLWKGI